MTTIDFRSLLKEAKQKKASSLKEEQRGTASPSTSSLETTDSADGATFEVEDIGDVLFEPLDERFKVGPVPTVYYIPDYISIDEETQLSHQIRDPKYSSRWVTLKTRRLQNWGGTPVPSGMLPEQLPVEWSQPLFERLCSERVFPVSPNHILVNEYLPGQGIMPHEDGPLYLPNVAILSLNSHAVMRFRPHPRHKEPSRELFSLFLERRSLLVFREDVYTKYLHAIEELKSDRLDDDTICNLPNRDQQGEFASPLSRDTRLSLTIRRVKKVLKKKH